MSRLTTGLLLGLMASVIGLNAHAAITSAHVLKQDNGVSAVLHIAPFDAPTSGEDTRIEIEFSNTSHTFSLQNYAIRLQLTEDGNTISTKTVEAAYFGTATTGVANVVFPKADVYGFRVLGTPRDTEQAFQMDYTVRVTAGKGQTNPIERKPVLDASSVLGIGSAAFILLAMFAVKEIISGGKYKAH